MLVFCVSCWGVYLAIYRLPKVCDGDLISSFVMNFVKVDAFLYFIEMLGLIWLDILTIYTQISEIYLY
jgi:hypothetical protein